MFLKIATTHQPAPDIGHLLRKNPANVHRADLSFGRSVLFFPQADEARAEAVLVIDIDPIQLVRGRKDSQGQALLGHYVNDRPYAASSFLSVAMARVLRDAMAGKAPEREALAKTKIPLELSISPLPGNAGVFERLFLPLGYDVKSEAAPLDENFPDWGESKYHTLTLKGEQTLADALTHLYVLIPVLDNAKHYWIGDDEVDKLITKGGAWVQSHPERDFIANRYLRRKRYAREALTLLDEKFGAVEEETEASPDEKASAGEAALEKPLGLNAQRYEAVSDALKSIGARKVCDLGCGDGKLLMRLIQDPHLDRIVGFDVSTIELEKAERRLKLDRMSPSQRARVDVYRGSLVYEDDRFKGYDAICLVEVIEHVDPERLDALERVVFKSARGGAVIVTTPNVEYNAKFEDMTPGEMRHSDHRFEWTRAEFEGWAAGVCDRQGYQVRFFPIGTVDEVLGAPTQMAVFERGA